MSRKLKFILGGLVLIAGFLVFRGGSYILRGYDTQKKVLGSSTITANTDGVVTLLSDSDFDGLFDAEEGLYDTDAFKADTDGDGYLDGEEALSGFNPSEADVKKELAQRKTKNNLTLTYIDNLLGALADNALSGDTAVIGDEDNMKIISLSMLDSLPANLAKPVSSPIVSREKSYSDAVEYLAEAARLMNFLPPQDKYFSDLDLDTKKGKQKTIMLWYVLSRFFDNTGNKLNALAVPQEFLEWHKKTTETLARGAALYRGLASMDSDPFLSMGIINIMPDVMVNLELAGNELNGLMRDYNMVPIVHPYHSDFANIISKK